MSSSVPKTAFESHLLALKFLLGVARGHVVSPCYVTRILAAKARGCTHKSGANERDEHKVWLAGDNVNHYQGVPSSMCVSLGRTVGEGTGREMALV